jgi:hypothetical protein
MSTKAIEPEPSEWLRLLTGNRLQTQVSRSGVLVGGALGVMALDLAAALIVLGDGGAYALSILALLALGASFGLAMRALHLPGAKDAGPSLEAMRRARESKDARELEDSLLDDIDAILDTVARPDLHALDPQADRERFYRQRAFPGGWLRVVVDFSAEPAWIVTAVAQDNDPRG